MSEIQGYIDHIIYRNAENGYTVLVLENDDGEMTLTGSFRTIEEGEILHARGDIVHHPSYGQQFKVKEYEIKQPEDVVSIERYLSSGAIKGVGQVMAGRIVKKFGEDTFRIMEEEPERLTEIKGISERIARQIAAQVQEKRGMRRAMLFLQELDIGTNLAVKIYAFYGDRVFEVIKNNPYQLVEDIKGVGFFTADEIALKAKIAPDSQFRIRSGILYSLSQAQAEGHMYLPYERLVSKSRELLNIEEEELGLQLENLIMEGKLIEKQEEGEKKIFSSYSYFVELDCARRLCELDVDGLDEEEKLPDTFRSIEGRNEIELDEKQRRAAVISASRGVSVITGGPGTGKTTIIKILLKYFDAAGMDVELAAPTGRAAKRMTEATGYEARTIHRMLEIGGEDISSFGRNEDNPIEADVVIIDEMSMVDIFLFHALLRAISVGTRLILVGDACQLPSVGPGSVLKDIIQSGRISVSTLDKIFRQAAESDIVMNAHRINHGEHLLMDNASRDFFFLQRQDPEVIIEALVYLITKKLPPYVQARPEEIQIMTPMKKGILGVENLNKVLQQRLNPAKPGLGELVSGEVTYRVGDKVMQIKNDYQLEWEICGKYGISIDKGMGIFNGDVGVVDSIDSQAGIVRVRFDENRMVNYNHMQLEELEHAYAITIHKSQGSEYPAVILPLLQGPQMLMNRNLLYTAVTRARKCVMIVGSRQVVDNMIDNKNEQVRFTALRERIGEF